MNSSAKSVPRMTATELTQIIRARKTESRKFAEKKRLNGLRRICEMNSRTGIDPLDLFPSEVWEVILCHLKSPNDRANMYQLHPMFRELLGNTVVGDVLFPLVMDHNIPLTEKSLCPCTSRRAREHNFHMKFPATNDDASVRNFLTSTDANICTLASNCSYVQGVNMHDLARLRVVSKTFRNAIDKWFETNLVHIMRNEKSSDGLYKVTIDLKHSEINKLFEMLECCETRIPTLFLRAMRINLQAFQLWRLEEGPCETEDEREWIVQDFHDSFPLYRDKLYELLDSVGHQILHFHFSLGWWDHYMIGYLSDAMLYEMVRGCLSRLPNLKWFTLELSNIGQLPITDNANLLEKMPTLKDLERVDMKCSQASPIVQAILFGNPQIKYCIQVEQDHASVVQTDLADPLLKSLELQTVKVVHPPVLIFTDTNWKLKNMALELGATKMNSHALGSIFHCLEHFQTLEKLSLDVGFADIGDCGIDYLRLPNLKELNLALGLRGCLEAHRTEWRFLLSLQFLLRCAKLSKLVWHNHMYNSSSLGPILFSKAGEEELIHFRGGEADLTKSNLWKVFPSMSSASVRFRKGANSKRHRYFNREYEMGKLVREDRKKW